VLYIHLTLYRSKNKRRCLFNPQSEIRIPQSHHCTVNFTGATVVLASGL
jgi:hypothetical protein